MKRSPALQVVLATAAILAAVAVVDVSQILAEPLWPFLAWMYP